MRSVFWLRHDLRLHDNKTLSEFCEKSAEGYVFWCPSRSFWRAGPRRRAFILASLLDFREAVARCGGQLFISMGRLEDVLPSLLAENFIEAVFFSKEPTTEEKEDEQFIHRQKGTKIFSYSQDYLIQPLQQEFIEKPLPQTFTTFRHQVEPRLTQAPILGPPLKWPRSLESVRVSSVSAGATDFDADFDLGLLHPQIPPGETGGLARLKEYIWEKDKLKDYKNTRNGLLDWDDSSKLSPYLALGLLSPRLIHQEVKKYETERIQNESTYWLIFELLWRDYFRLVAEHKRSKLFTAKSAYHNDLEAPDSAARRFEHWCNGRTDDEFINANMNELNSTGWMSNRGRQNVASYLAKTLGLDWRWGAAYFEKTLIDYDASNNWGNWAYLAGVGQDPRDRRFNSQRQSQLYDPDGTYRSRWGKV